MPIFELKEFEPILRNLITGYEESCHKSIVQHFQQQVTVSYSIEEISMVFGIPNRGKEIEKNSMTVEEKKKWLKLLCRKDHTSLEWEGILKNSRGLKKIFIENDEWLCVVDLVKSKLTAGSRTFDISLWMLLVVDGLYKGQTYN